MSRKMRHHGVPRFDTHRYSISSTGSMGRLRAESIILSPDKVAYLQRQKLSNIVNYILVGMSLLLIIGFLPFSLVFCIKIVKEYERAVIFRLGRLKSSKARGPGLMFIVPCVDEMRRVDLRTVSFDVPPQELLSKDSVTVSVDAVVYFRISNPVISITNVADAFISTKLLAQTTLRNVLGTRTLADMLSDRDRISHLIQGILDEATDPWGVKVERVEVKDIRLPRQLMRSMAAEAEADREARAKLVAAEGEQKASRYLKEAARIVTETPIALQLRYLQELSAISSQHNHTVVVPIPMDLVEKLILRNQEPADPPVQLRSFDDQ